MFRIAIVGRPNVGKSTLFNRLSRTRRSLVGNEPGMTRDRIFQLVQWPDREFELIDTGGIIPDEKEEIPGKVLEQAELAIDGSDLVLLVVDARAGLNPLDREVAQYLKSRGADFWVVANKVDVSSLEADALQFTRMGTEVFPISAEHNLGILELEEKLTELIPEGKRDTERDEIRIAIIGRPNVGKSSLINRFLGQERVIVTATPGTTRDAVDSFLEHEGQLYRLIDTAGIRRKGRTELMAEKLSVVMARKHMASADVVFLVIDAVEGATKPDATIGGYAHDEGRPVVIVVNKWDQVEKDTDTTRRLEADFRDRMRFLDYAPMIFVSAQTGLRVFKALQLAREAYSGSRLRVPTAELNAFLQDDVASAMLRRDSSKKFPLKYACQVGAAPPTFVLFLRGSSPLHFSTVRFLSNRLREKYGFFATPIRLIQKPQAPYSKRGGKR